MERMNANPDVREKTKPLRERGTKKKRKSDSLQLKNSGNSSRYKWSTHWYSGRCLRLVSVD